MLIIADSRIPTEAKNKLEKYGELVLLKTSGITENSISGHPDIFFCNTSAGLIIAPNLPQQFKENLRDKNVSFIEGILPVGKTYPDAARYNAVITNHYLIHRIDISDAAIINDCKELVQINVKQGFSRCSLLPLKNNYYITSDEGIYKTLLQNKRKVLLVSPEGIILQDHQNGFFGGACGLNGNQLFILGTLKHYKDGKKVKSFAKSLGYEIIELYAGPLFDGGSIIFIPQ
ncbi:MAG: DUF6873 family GME fold protein [Bacteroidales bacterium]|jgi:hypothetical protein